MLNKCPDGNNKKFIEYCLDNGVNEESFEEAKRLYPISEEMYEMLIKKFLERKQNQKKTISDEK